MQLSEQLFAPTLDLKWKWEGTNFLLILDSKIIWESKTGATRWDYPCRSTIARYLLGYIGTPVAKLKKGDINKIARNAYHYEPAVRDNFLLLGRILLAADRRIGKNIQSIRLFTEPDQRIRNIIGRRL